MSHSPKLTQKQVLLTILTVAMVVLSIGTVFYHYVESLSWLDAFYFSTITLTTIGYGDISPKTDLGKLFTIPYSIMGIAILGAVISTVSQRRIEKMKERHLGRLENHPPEES